MIGQSIPPGTVAALTVMVLIPIATYVLYRIDAKRADGYVSVLGRR
jgi:hypothetical protein